MSNILSNILSNIIFFDIIHFNIMVLYFSMWFKNGLKAQKLLAQGIALVNTDANLSPCKGKSFIITKYLKLLPLQGALLFAIIPRAMPWEGTEKGTQF